MRTPILIVVAAWATGCAANIKPETLAHRRYRYIDDTDSRIAQHKMRQHKREVHTQNGIVEFLFSKPEPQGYNPEPKTKSYESLLREKDFKRIKLVNKTKKTFFADIVGEISAEDSTGNNVKNIKLPPGEKLVLYLWLNDAYQLTYGFSEAEKTTRRRFVFGEYLDRLVVRTSGIKDTTPPATSWSSF